MHILLLTGGNVQVLTVDWFSKTVCVLMVGKPWTAVLSESDQSDLSTQWPGAEWMMCRS